jgi:acyl-CoA dehydrogenase
MSITFDTTRHRSDHDDLDIIRTEVRRLCDKYGNEYWRSLEPDRYPEEFVTELTANGWLGALIPEEYGGGGLNLAGASVILEEISARAATPARATPRCTSWARCCATAGGAEAALLPGSPTGPLRLQAFGVTEPAAGSETTAIRTRAERDGDVWRINGQKIWTSRALYSDLMILLARTTPADQVANRLDGLSVFLVEMRDANGELIPG